MAGVNAAETYGLEHSRFSPSPRLLAIVIAETRRKDSLIRSPLPIRRCPSTDCLIEKSCFREWRASGPVGTQEEEKRCDRGVCRCRQEASRFSETNPSKIGAVGNARVRGEY